MNDAAIATQTEEAKKSLELVNKIPVETQAQREIAAKILVEIKTQIKEVEKQRDEVAKPAYEAYKKMREKAKPILEPLEQCEAVLKRRIAEGEDEDKKRTQAALAAAVAEGKSGEEVAAIVAAAPDKLEGVSMKKIPKYRVKDESLIPREYLSVNHSKVQLALHSDNPQPIPGIEFYYDTSVSAKARK